MSGIDFDKVKTKKIEFGTTVDLIRNYRTTMFHMLGEIIDNSIGSIGIDISENNNILNNRIEIFFEEKEVDNNKVTNLHITDNCGGIEADDNVIEGVMVYGRRKNYYEKPFFNVYGHGLKQAAIWSGEKLKLISKRNNIGFEINVEWKDDGEQNEYTYQYIENPQLKFMSDNADVTKGTKVSFFNIYTNDETKYSRSNYELLAKFLGWRYGKYIEKGLRIELHLQEKDGKFKNDVFKTDSKTDGKLKNEEPKYESFEKYFEYLQKKFKNYNLQRSDFNDWLYNELSSTVSSVGLDDWLKSCIYENKELAFSGVFVTDDNEQNEYSYPYKIGIMELNSYSKKSYEDYYGLSIYQAYRAISHGPRVKGKNIDLPEPLSFMQQDSIRGGKSVVRRFIGFVDVDDYVEKNFDKNVIQKSKELVTGPPELMSNLFAYFKDTYQLKLENFLNKLMLIQTKNLYIDYLKNKEIDTDNSDGNGTYDGNGGLTPLPPNQPQPESEDGGIIKPGSGKLEELSYKILSKVREQNFNLEWVPEISFSKSTVITKLPLIYDNLIKIFVNKNYFESYKIQNSRELQDFLAKQALEFFIEEDETLSKNDKKVLRIKKILGDEND
ncbi:hypothetical protein SHELI_v1c04370 [Spiroplasma helicoides]|uniref:Histidine kinase/HSP90-like ATPase domain-containing protein n=1 Tax=Spiroplasma helicoides TaxID=216938 RepID=A0A1B3SKD3_9MOLU|nr:ATP-binding protein [Spiroplasma helicoides]AOG60388.1 hypothetical protein SHELI_v1c04370 [Spiroplasma helicoides]